LKKKLIKNKKEVLREFNKEKYFNAYRFFRYKKPDLKDVDRFFYKRKRDFLALQKEKKIMINEIKKFSKNTKSITELGCGYGSRGLELLKFEKLKNKKFFLLDMAVNGIKLAKLIVESSKKYVSKINLGICDFYNNKKNKIKIPKKSMIFTSYALHYKRKLSDKFLRFILKRNPTYVVHFEPVYEHFTKDSKSHNNIKNYFIENNYSLNLLTILKSYEKMKKIKIILEKKHVFGINKLLPLSIIVWKKIS